MRVTGRGDGPSLRVMHAAWNSVMPTVRAKALRSPSYRRCGKVPRADHTRDRSRSRPLNSCASRNTGRDRYRPENLALARSLSGTGKIGRSNSERYLVVIESVEIAASARPSWELDTGLWMQVV